MNNSRPIRVGYSNEPITRRPIYALGFDREQAERITHFFMRGYQPPIECHHRPGKLLRRVDGVRGRFRACMDCGMVVGVIA